MPPNQYDNQGPEPSQTSSPQSNYDFFLNPAPAPKKPLINLGGSSFKKRIIIIVGGLIGFIIIIVILSSLLGNHTNYVPIISIAQDQNELVRVATEGTTNTTQQPTQDLSLDIELSLTTDQLNLLAYLKTSGQVISTKVLDATADAASDQALTAASAVSDYDPTFTKIMQAGLQNYIEAISAAYTTVGPNGKTLLRQEAAHAKTLLTLANSTANSLQN